jgi:3D (Asp-Asp-Asp) domain-containing protein
MNARQKNMLIFVSIVFFEGIAITAFRPHPEPMPMIQEASAKEITSDPPPEPNQPKIINMLVTAYCPCKICCGKYADGKTSTGSDARKPGVAADPKLLPYGTKLKIPGIKEVLTVDDTGGAMRQDAKKGICHIDIRFPAHHEALQFGRKWLNVEILN